MIETEIIKVFATGGSVACCVSMVILFLRYMKESNAANQVRMEMAITSMGDRHAGEMKQMRETFQEESKQTREAFQNQIGSMTSRVFDVMSGTSASLTEISVAVKGLEVAVRDLQEKIK